MTEKVSVNSAARLSEAIHKLTQLYRDRKYVVVSMRPGKDRTLDQNALWFAMYQRIAQIVLLPCYHGVCEEVESLDETMRAVGGFGSTGR